MQNNKDVLSLLQGSSLFRDIGTANLPPMLHCLGAETKDVGKDETILLAGDQPTDVGMVLKGQLHIYREDYDGNRSLLAAVTPGELFAETLCCANVQNSPVTVVANTPSCILLLRFKRILHTCPNSCPHHRKLIENMLGVIASKNLLLQSRMEVVSLKSVRAKVERFLEAYADKPGVEFSIPFNRDEMAAFLCVERSALSHELMRMKREGLIEYRKNRFVLVM